MKTIDDLSIYVNVQGVYGIKNTKNDKMYVGSTCSQRGISKRAHEHVQQLKQNTHPNSHLQRAWSKYGEESFVFVELEIVSVVTELVVREQYWIDFLQSADRNFGYNLCQLAGSTRGRKMSEETKRKIGAANRGKKRTEAFKQMMSQMKKGQTLSAEAREQISQANSGVNHWLYGKQHSQKSIEKMRASHSGKICTAAEVEKRSSSIRSVTRKNTSSGYKGVCWDKQANKWKVTVDGRTFAGLFEDVKEAALNYDYHMRGIYGDGCYVNFPDHDFSGFEAKKVLEW